MMTIAKPGSGIIPHHVILSEVEGYVRFILAVGLIECFFIFRYSFFRFIMGLLYQMV